MNPHGPMAGVTDTLIASAAASHPLVYQQSPVSMLEDMIDLADAFTQATWARFDGAVREAESRQARRRRWMR